MRRGGAYWAQGRADLKEARARLRKGRPLDSAYMSLQAAINALSAVCYLNGVARIPNHGAQALLALCAEADGRFDALVEDCAVLETVQERNPHDPEADAAEEARFAASCHGHGEAVIRMVKGYLKEHRRRFGRL